MLILLATKAIIDQHLEVFSSSMEVQYHGQVRSSPARLYRRPKLNTLLHARLRRLLYGLVASFKISLEQINKRFQCTAITKAPFGWRTTPNSIREQNMCWFDTTTFDNKLQKEKLKSSTYLLLINWLISLLKRSQVQNLYQCEKELVSEKIPVKHPMSLYVTFIVTKEVYWFEGEC